MLLMQAGDSLTDASGHYRQDHGCKMIRTAASLHGCLVQLVSNNKGNPLSLHLLCNQGNHLLWSKQPFFVVVFLYYI